MQQSPEGLTLSLGSLLCHNPRTGKVTAWHRLISYLVLMKVCNLSPESQPGVLTMDSLMRLHQCFLGVVEDLLRIRNVLAVIRALEELLSRRPSNAPFSRLMQLVFQALKASTQTDAAGIIDQWLDVAPKFADDEVFRLHCMIIKSRMLRMLNPTLHENLALAERAYIQATNKKSNWYS